jgi:hypothetical protein
MCGSAKINGYTFCSGISRLQLSYKDHSALQSLVRPLIYLIRGAIFRPKYATGSSGALSLGELVDMYHTRKATERHDKVYALLSMSSDDLSLAGLSPDYKVPWKTLLQRVIKFILSEEVSVETWDNKEIAVIEGKGCVLGQISSVETDGARSDRQHVNIIFNDTPNSLQYKKEYGDQWTLQASAQSIRENDIVYLLQGTSKPVLIRACKDHFSLVMIAVTPRQGARTESGNIESHQPLPSIKNFSRDFLLIWNWEAGLENLQDRARDESSVEINDLVPEYLMTDAKKADISIKTALILGDTKNYDEAKNKIQKELENHEAMLGKEDLRMLALKESLAWIYKNKEQWTEAENLMLQVIQIREEFQGTDNHDTRESIAKLASIYLGQEWFYIPEKDLIMIRLAGRIRDNAPVEEEDLIKVAELDDGRVMRILLGPSMNKNNILVTERVLEAAASNHVRPNGEEVMKLLLEKQGPDTITKEVIDNALGNLYNTRKIMKVLLEKRADIRITEDLVKVVASRSGLGAPIMELFLEERDADIVITEDLMRAVCAGQHGKEVMMLLLEKRGADVIITEEMVIRMVELGKKVMMSLLEKREAEVAITEEVVKAAARSWWGGGAGEVMMLLLEKRGAEVVITEEVVRAVVRNREGLKEVLIYLLENRGTEVVITEEVVKALAANRWQGKEMMMLLLEKRGAEVVITEEVVKAAAGNRERAKEVMMILIEERGAEVVITEEVLKAIAENKRGKEVMMFLLQHRREEVDAEITVEVVKAAATSGEEGFLEIVNQELGYRIPDEEWSTSAFYASAYFGQHDKVRQLLADGINPDFKNPRLVSPLWIAAKNGWGKVVQLLLDSGLVDVNSKNIAGQPPIFWPAAKGDERVVTLLLQAGANCRIVDNDGNTPLSIAEGNGRYDIVRMMNGQWDQENIRW